MTRPPVRNDLTAERLRELLSYDPNTGVFRWKVDRGPGKSRIGLAAGSVFKSKPHLYLRITINEHRYMAHRLAWLYVNGEWPTCLIDHRDGNGLNNRFSNLRLASHVENARNTTKRGYCWVKAEGKYIAYVYVAGKQINLGRFDTKEEALAARVVGADEHFGEFSPSNRTAA